MKFWIINNSINEYFQRTDGEHVGSLCYHNILFNAKLVTTTHLIKPDDQWYEIKDDLS